MPQHFLRSAAARPLPLATVMRMSEDQAYRWFCRARWCETDGEPQCPRCGSVGAWDLCRRRYKCRVQGCRAEFSVTSGTIFAHRKLRFRQILAAISLSANAANGRPALQVARELGVDYKTAWTTLMKLREAIAAERDTVPSRDVGESPPPSPRVRETVEPRTATKAAVRKRARKGLLNIHHRVGDQYLDLYEAERAWRSDHRRSDNRTLVEQMLKSALGHPGPGSMRGYWQRHRRNDDDRPQGPGRSTAAPANSGRGRQGNFELPVGSRGTAEARK